MNQDKTKKILRSLDFLISKYGYQFKFQTFELYHNFIGPMDAYSFYNDFGCLTLHNAVQRGEWGVYVAKQISCDQASLLEQEVCLTKFTNKSFWTTAGFLKELSKIIKKEIEMTGCLFGLRLN